MIGIKFPRATLLAASALAIAFAPATQAQDVSFEGETVNIMVNFAAGGGTDTAARLVAPFIARHLPGSPDYIVTNTGGAGGVAAVEFLMDSLPRDGLNIGYFAGTILRWSLGLQQVPEGTGELPFVAARSVNQIIVSHTDLGLTPDNIADHEGPLFFAANSPDNHVSIRMRLFMDALGIEDFTVLSGYRGQGNMVSAVRAREADLAVTNDSFFGSNRDAITGDDVLEPFAQMGQYQNGAVVAQAGLEDIPVFDAILRDQAPDFIETAGYQAWESIMVAMAVQNVFVLPPGTPDEFIPVWEEAILAAYSDPEFIEMMGETGVPLPAVVGTETINGYMDLLRERFANPAVSEAVQAAIATNEM